MLRNFRKGISLAQGVFFPDKRATAGSRLARSTSLKFESLEPRLVLDVGPAVISEFLAVNDGVYPDVDGEFSDWIEIHNPTDTRVYLDGWHLTDDRQDLEKWELPDVWLDPDDYTVVFASAKDRRDPAAELHTNFQLDGAGEYLALVRADGTTVATEFSPAFPQQREDFSYGTSQDASAFTLEGLELSYLVPASGDAPLGITWTGGNEPFDDSAWGGFALPPRVLITEAGTGDPDFVEIQNLSGETVDTSGWVVAVNNADDRAGPPNINAWHNRLWNLPASMTEDEVRYRTDIDDGTGNYWEDNIFWRTGGKGWAILLDDDGNVIDFAVWGYQPAEIASLDVTINGHHVTVDGIWTGDAIPVNVSSGHSLQRSGLADHDDLSDWAAVTPMSMGLQNEDLTVPFAGRGVPGIGFETDPPGLIGAVQLDVESEMHDVNASLWTRIPFEVDDPLVLDTMQLRMKYNDGFVAYINGQEVARRNEPASLQWDSNATAARSVEDSLLPEEINISDHLGVLQTGSNVLAVHGLNVGAGDGNFLLLPEVAVTSRRYFGPPTPGQPNGIGFRGFVKDTKFSVDRGFFEDPFELVITTDTPGATIYYTVDGSEPYLAFDDDDPIPTNGSKYIDPLTISSTTTLRAVAFKKDFQPTNIDTHTYVFLQDVIRQSPTGGAPPGWPSGSVNGQIFVYGMDPDIVDSPTWGPQMEESLRSIPALSMVTDLDNLFHPSTGIYTNATSDGPLWERPTSLELLYPSDAEGAGFPDLIEVTDPGGSVHWEFPQAMEEGFQIDAGVRIRGGYSRQDGNPKHAFRFFFRKEYGDAKLDYPLFGTEGADRFDKVDLRTSQNYSWAFGGPNHNTMVREVSSRDAQGEMGAPYTRSRYYHLYINGQYWGIYQTQERSEARYAATYFGGEVEDYDVIHQNDSRQIYATDGNTQAYYRLRQATLSGFANNVNYYRAQGMNPDGTRNPDYERLLDVDNLIDYMILTFYVADNDGPGSHYTRPRPNNYWAVYNRENPDGFKFFAHDMEHSYGRGTTGGGRYVINNLVTPLLTSESGQSQNFNAHWLHQELTDNEEYVVRFADRVYKHFFNDGVLTDATSTARINNRAAQIDRAIIAESARWGDTKTHPPKNYNDWVGNVNAVKNWLGGRNNEVIDQISTQGWWLPVDAPAFNQHGGQVPPNFDLTISAPSGTIYYTLDGSDPRQIGGNVLPGARTYNGTPITLTESILVKARVRDGSQWSPLNEAQFFVHEPASAENLVITELNYNPYDPTADELDVDPNFENNDFEFIELRNISGQPVSMIGVQLTDGVTFDFDTVSADTLAAGGSVILVRNAAAFQARYGTGISLAGQYDGKLSNEGEQIELEDFFGNPIARFAYNDAGNWPGRAGGKGASLELISPDDVPVDEPQRTAYLEDGDNWRSSSEYGGSPGSVGSGPLGDVVVNEVLTHTETPLLDTIELHNRTGAAIDVTGWYLSDSWGWESNEDNGNYKKFRIRNGTSIPALGYLVFDEDDFNPTWDDPQAEPGPYDFALSGAHGDDVWLMEADTSGTLTRFVDHVDFGAAREGESWGRWPNGSGDLYPMLTPTLDPQDGANSGPRVGPVLIGEVHYNPQPGLEDDDLEFIEVYNTTGQTIDLTNWRVRGGIDYDFPAGSTLDPRAVLVLVPFELTEADKLAAFRAEYNIIGEPVQILGGYTGRLNDDGERVTLQRADAEPPDEPGFIPHLLEDEVRYDDVQPWPVDADGGGEALHRSGLDAWGNTHLSWNAEEPNPGTPPFEVPADARVVGRHVFYNQSAFDGNDAAAGVEDDAAIATDKQPLLPGTAATFANYTSYSRGINGIMVDVDGLPVGALPGVDDFRFRIGNGNDLLVWTTAPSPSGVTLRAGAGVEDSDRVTILWPEGVIQKQWLEVTVLVTAATGLAEEDVFYFGNAIGEAGNSTADAKVNATDMLAARNHQRTFVDPAPIDFAFDFNRDARVNATDMLIARNHQTNFLDALELITVPGGKAAASADATDAAATDTAALEAVRTQSVARESTRGESSSGRLAWLYEFDQSGTPQRANEQDRPAEQAVDVLLGTYRP